MKTPPRLFIFRPFFLIAMALAVLGGATYQWIWRTRVEHGPQAVPIVEWIKKNALIRERTGQVNSVRLLQLGSTFSFGNSASGCYHYVLDAAQGPAEIWVSWHQENDARPLEFDRLEVASEGQRRVIWAAEK
jgi:hypothetical protein